MKTTEIDCQSSIDKHPTIIIAPKCELFTAPVGEACVQLHGEQIVVAIMLLVPALSIYGKEFRIVVHKSTTC